VLAVIGHLARDVIAGGAPRIGGGPWHAARALRALRADALLVAKCGADDEAAFRAELETTGVPFRLVVGETTTAFSFTYDDAGVRTMLVDAIGDPWRPDELREVEADWLQVAPLLRGDFLELPRGRVLLDGQGVVRVRELGPLRLEAGAVPVGVEILKLADEEAAVLGPVDVPELVVTHGVRGATVNGRLVEADPVDRDPTGAGDMFGAAYLVARAAGAEPVEAGRSAALVVADLLRSAPR
jgi:sugar/nucleoside kinase (ribokinase family)